jgi:hypothetical protein
MKTNATKWLLLSLPIALAQAASASDVWLVNGANGSDSNSCISPQTACKTIGHALSLASSGDFILVAPAIYAENLTISFSVTVIGASADTTAIDGGGVGRVIYIPSQTAKVNLWGLTIRNGVLRTGTKQGPGVFNFGSLTINFCTITNNLAVGFGGFGGGIFNEGDVTINDSRISQNGHVLGGGGIYSSGHLTINNSTIAANSAGIGGGIENRSILNSAGALTGGTLTIKNSTLSSNTALSVGGGIQNLGSLVIVNSTLNGNTATDVDPLYNGNGGAISNGGTLAVFNATFSGNSALNGGAIFSYGARATLQNSIVANSTTGGNCGGRIVSHGYNLSSDETCNFSKRGDLNNIDPILGPLRNHGGPTQTLALQNGSAAIDSGNPSGCTDEAGHLLRTDQRGKPRPDKEDTRGCDMGAYERQTD